MADCASNAGKAQNNQEAIETRQDRRTSLAEIASDLGRIASEKTEAAKTLSEIAGALGQIAGELDYTDPGPAQIDEPIPVNVGFVNALLSPAALVLATVTLMEKLSGAATFTKALLLIFLITTTILSSLSVIQFMHLYLFQTRRKSSHDRGQSLWQLAFRAPKPYLFLFWTCAGVLVTTILLLVECAMRFI